LNSFPDNDYYDLATSANGQYLYVVDDTAIYLSSDFGNTMNIVYTSTEPYLNCITCSATGQYAAVTAQDNAIYVTSNYGQTWTQAATTSQQSFNWHDIAMCSNGQYLVAVAIGFPVYMSNNFGNSFFASGSPQAEFYYVAISDNTGSSGQFYAYAATINSHVFQTVNGRSSWAPSFYQWHGVASSQDSQYRVAAVSSFYLPAVVLSSDYGITWQQLLSPFKIVPDAVFYSAACNADCQ
jgi:photosystem II stability/assembly factor-like uncharacterized protein